MIEVKKSVIVPYSAEKMFNLVVAIKNYPHYLPWCTHLQIKYESISETIATIYIEYLTVKMHFTTKNRNFPYSKIEMQLIEGPFKELNGQWNFTSLGNNGCKIDFYLNYKFSNHLLEKLIGPMFKSISKNLVECFIQEAHKQYGSFANQR